MNKEETIAQSKSAYKQHKEIWRKHASANKKYKQNDLFELMHSGVGKACVLVANGASLEDDIDALQKYQDNVDIVCCDKTLGHLLDNGITPTYIVVCDAKVDYEKYLDPWKDKVQDVTLLINVCSSNEWIDRANWKDFYFFVNEDVIDSHKEFSELSGCTNFVPAGTNVSNAMFVLMTQSSNKGRNNYFGYDKYLLSGYDYCWLFKGNYYAFDETGNGKHNYMRHTPCLTAKGEYAFTSTNLQGSMRWAKKYIETFKLPIVQCSKKSILLLPNKGDLEEQMQYNFKRKDREKVKRETREMAMLKRRMLEIDQSLKSVAREHHLAFLQTV